MQNLFSIENNLNFYYGDVEDLSLNCRYVIISDSANLQDLGISPIEFNTQGFNLIRLNEEYNKLENYIKSEKYKDIFEFVKNTFFIDYLNNGNKNIKISNYLKFMNQYLIFPNLKIILMKTRRI